MSHPTPGLNIRKRPSKQCASSNTHAFRDSGRSAVLSFNDSSDEEIERDEMITSFDQFSARKSKEPRLLEISGQQTGNNWLEVVRSRNGVAAVPDIRPPNSDQIKGGLQQSGLIIKERPRRNLVPDEPIEAPPSTEEKATEDQLAMRALLAPSGLDQPEESLSIPLPESERQPIIGRERAAYYRDIEILPESASLTSYEDVPVSQFGAALLRGMGWKDESIKSFEPAVRPALLGIGAKERELVNSGDRKAKMPRGQREKYVPLVRVSWESIGGVRQAGGNDRRHASFSRRSTPYERR